MVEFTLPANSKVQEGKTFPAPPGVANAKAFKVYRWSPDDGKNPRVDTFHVDLDDCVRWSSMRSSRSKTRSTLH